MVQVNRLMIVDDARHVEGVVSVSDVVQFLVSRQQLDSPTLSTPR